MRKMLPRWLVWPARVVILAGGVVALVLADPHFNGSMSILFGVANGLWWAAEDF